MQQKFRSERALEAALKAMDCPSASTAAITLFMAAARHLDATVDNKRFIADLAYSIADDFAVGRRF